MNKETYTFTREELTYLMNGAYLQSSKYKIMYSTWEPEINEESTITLTADDVRDMDAGLEVEHHNVIFKCDEEPECPSV